MPLAIVVLVLAVDKIALLDAFQDCCAVSGKVSSFQASLDYDFSQMPMIQTAREAKKKLAMNFGSSRSFGYYVSPTAEQTAASPYLTASEKELLAGWEIVSLAYPGASIVTNYVRMNQWLDRGARPDLIMVEISHFSFNRSSMWFAAEIKHGMPLDFTVRRIFEIPWEHSRMVIGSRIFALSRFRVGKPQVSASQWEMLFQQWTNNNSRRLPGMPPEAGSQRGREPNDQKLLYAYTASEMKRTMFSAYRIDPDLKSYVFAMARRARRENIPIVFWRPAVHPTWQTVIDQTKSADDWSLLIRDIRAAGGIYIDLNSPDLLKCDYFRDPVHMDVRCFPEMAVRKITASR